ncbi:hypothetical protein CEUSTIGMA_g10064.t1 [Chlamydomonas eustigma]|uniref:Chlorophyll a-b binding protein, chloroplastic n=1 Tax=Chlamydomonas eustigma TaxID=1157962 RepID=A0A250XHT7_9CHLO|nr:hypothetical protein CEUSTIGMA_g10064.t1 [Chlamydomonas eustigma]|eukprot:GAX82638.1 hypothetical protein CEUSTIGMA_g10064.t1 [Chlamydomonas eustigma]
MSLKMMNSVSRTVAVASPSRLTCVSVSANTAGGKKTVSGGKTVSGNKTVVGANSESKRQTEVAAYLETLPGYGPLSGPFEGVWDPLNLSATASLGDVRRWRESEITHGRVAMLAAIGFIVGEQLQDYSLFYNFDGGITGPAINHFSQVKQGFWEPLLIAIGLAESYRTSIGWATPKGTGFNQLKDDDEYETGDLGFDPLGLKPEDPEELKLLQTKELNNGRLAMIAIAGFVLQEVAEPGVEIFEHLFFNVEKEVIEEIDEIEAELGLPPSIPIPTL